MLTQDPFLADVKLPTHDCPPGQSAIEDWEAEHAEAFGSSSPWEGALNYEDRSHVDQLREALELSSVKSATARYEGRVHAQALAQTGMSFDEIAGRCLVDPLDIARLFCKSDKLAYGTLEAERLIRSGDWDGDVQPLAALIGIDARSVHRTLLPALGITTKAGHSLRSGGGLKYSAEQYEAIRKFRTEDGRSFGWIGKQMAMDRTTVARICKRRGWELPK